MKRDFWWTWCCLSWGHKWLFGRQCQPSWAKALTKHDLIPINVAPFWIKTWEGKGRMESMFVSIEAANSRCRRWQFFPELLRRFSGRKVGTKISRRQGCNIKFFIEYWLSPSLNRNASTYPQKDPRCRREVPRTTCSIAMTFRCVPASLPRCKILYRVHVLIAR
jgi:hypothetical protein